MSRRRLFALSISIWLLTGAAHARLGSAAPPRPRDDAAAIVDKVLTSASLPGLTWPFIPDDMTLARAYPYPEKR